MMHPRSDLTEASDVAGTSKEMPRYVSHKTVHALEIAVVDHHVISFMEEGYAPIEAPPEIFSRYLPVRGDFYVVYADGYKSVSPRKAFLEGYTRAL